MSAETNPARPERVDGLNLKDPAAPGKLFGLLRENFNNGDVKNPDSFITDALDLRSTGVVDRIDPLKEKLVEYGQNPALQIEIYKRMGQARAARDMEEAKQISELGKLWGMDLEASPARAEDAGTPEKRAEQLVRAVDYAEFGSSDELQETVKGGKEDSTELMKLPIVRDNDPSRAIVYGAEDANLLITLPYGTIVCVSGNKGGKFIIQGGGEIHSSPGTGPHISSFKLEFRDQEQFRNFTSWLQQSPAEALSSMVWTFVEQSPELKKAYQENQTKEGKERKVMLPDIFTKDRQIERVLIKEIETPPVTLPAPEPEPPTPEPAPGEAAAELTPEEAFRQMKEYEKEPSGDEEGMVRVMVQVSKSLNLTGDESFESLADKMNELDSLSKTILFAEDIKAKLKGEDIEQRQFAQEVLEGLGEDYQDLEHFDEQSRRDAGITQEEDKQQEALEGDINITTFYLRGDSTLEEFKAKFPEFNKALNKYLSSGLKRLRKEAAFWEHRLGSLGYKMENGQLVPLFGPEDPWNLWNQTHRLK